MHWVDVYAEELLQLGDSHLIESGTGISGQPHLGSASDIIYGDGILKAIEEKGGKARAIWAMDDMDGFRKLQKQVPESFGQHLGKPVSALPCPEDCCGSFVEHFTGPFLENLARIDVRPEAVSVAEMYRDGKYDETVKLALEKAAEIRGILKEVSGSEREDDWLPFFPICESCGKILTTKAYAYENGKVKYRCSGGVAGNTHFPGCQHEGLAGIREGKLPWRVEWAARWSHQGVTCEPMGKDLMAAGGTYESSKVICERIFNSPAPVPVPYEWIIMGGKRLEKSAGRVLTIREMIDIATPEIARYFFFRTKPTSHKDIDFGFGIPKLAEDYETAERVYFGDTEGVPEKEIGDIKRSYLVSQLKGAPEGPGQISYSHLVSIIQTNLTLEGEIDWDGVAETASRAAGIIELDGVTRAKAEAVKCWLDTHAPNNVKFSVLPEMPDVELNDDELRFLRELSAALEGIEWEAGAIHDTIYETSQSCGMKAGKCFRALYKVFLGQGRGPRLGFLLASLDRDFVAGRVRESAGL